MTPAIKAYTTPEKLEVLIKRTVPLGRFCEPSEIGEAVSFLASARADMITGQMLAVDGGTLTGYGEDLRAVLRKRLQEGEGH
jgi:NAD(P)-dependent dehydrogenase (short-subunit alcohol dehydrogenase family)